MEPYNNGKTNWQKHYDALFQLVADNPSQQDNLKAIQQNVEHWIQNAGEKVIALKKANDNKGIQQFFQDDPGKQDIDALREQISSFRSIEKQLTLNRVSALEKKNDQLRLQLYGSLLLVLIVSVISSYFTGALTARNVRKVGNAIAEIASSGGDLTKRITIKTKDETKDLADQTNLLLTSLQSMISDIRLKSDELERSSSMLKAGADESSKAASQISESVQRVAQGAEQQVSQTEEMSAILQETVSGLEQVAVTTTDVSNLACQACSIRGNGECPRNAGKCGKNRPNRRDVFRYSIVCHGIGIAV